MIPKHLHPLFWDICLDDFNPSSHPGYTISRILEYGDFEACTWLTEVFSNSEIAKVVRSDRSLTRKSANFWALVYGIPIEEVAALKQDAQKVLS